MIVFTLRGRAIHTEVHNHFYQENEGEEVDVRFVTCELCRSPKKHVLNCAGTFLTNLRDLPLLFTRESKAHLTLHELKLVRLL